MKKKQSQTSKTMIKNETPAEKAAREFLDKILQRDPRLKAARDSVQKSVDNGSSVVEQSLKTFRQRLKD